MTTASVTSSNAYITFVKRKRSDCLMNRSNFDKFQQAGLAVSGRSGRWSQYEVLVYDALERAYEHDVHDASNGVDGCLNSVDHDVTEPTCIFTNHLSVTVPLTNLHSLKFNHRLPLYVHNIHGIHVSSIRCHFTCRRW